MDNLLKIEKYMKKGIPVKTGIGWALKCPDCGELYNHVSDKELLPEMIFCECKDN